MLQLEIKYNLNRFIINLIYYLGPVRKKKTTAVLYSLNNIFIFTHNCEVIKFIIIILRY